MRCPAARRSVRALSLSLCLVVVGACPEDCDPTPTTDAGPDGGVVVDGGGGGSDAGAPGDGGDDGDASVAPACGPDTPGFGEECGDCGFWVCDPQADQLVCYDTGFNDCGACGDIDTSAGRLADACGEFGCGLVQCNSDGTATECLGDHARNVCGGCGYIFPEDEGASCSSCATGTRTCTRDMDELVCWRGRSQNNQCNSCEPCVQYHAFMDERLGGGYIKNGTVAVFEDAGNSQRQMVFLPLIEGPGANALVLAHLFLTNEPEPDIYEPPGFPNNFCTSSFDCPSSYDCVTEIGMCVKGEWLPQAFAAQISPLFLGADPVRSYPTVGISVGSFQYLMLYDWFLQEVVSLGEIVPGPPPGLLVDAGPEPDGGPSLDDGGDSEGGSDGGSDSGSDSGSDGEEAGPPPDGGPVDASDADDGGASDTDGGSDAG